MTERVKKNGFTLVELSIVIVIIGLIVSGVTAGSSLVHQAKLKQVTNDFNKYAVALAAFRLEYDAYPGDMPNAVSYWGAGTFNGNGDKQIKWVLVNGANEMTNAWAHLSLSKLIPENYDETYNYGTGTPKAPLTQSNTYLLANGPVSVCLRSMANWQDAATPKDAFVIDTKLDDGDPSAGKVTGSGASCVSGSSYILTNTTPTCGMAYKTGI